MADDLTDGLTEEEEFLNFLEQYWYTYGSVPTRARAEELGITNKLWDDSFKNGEFRKQCLERGISLRGLELDLDLPPEPIWRQQMLTEEQLTVANVLLDITDTRSAKKKLQDLGISTAKYQSFLKDPTYQDYIQSRAESMLGENQHEAHIALVDRVRSGDMSAIKYYNEITGRYVPSRGESNINVTLILMQMLEIIQRHVRDLGTQELIAQEFLALSEPTRTVKGALVPTPEAPSHGSETPISPVHKAVETFGGDL